MKMILSVLRSLKHSPLKSFLTLFTVGLGVGVLIFAISISQTFSRKVDEELKKEGMIITVANATFSEENGLDIVRPPQFDEKVQSILEQEISGVQKVSPLARPFWNEFIVGGKIYRIRSLAAVDSTYQSLTGMEIKAGSFFTPGDVEKGTKKAVISETLAKMLFGSVDNALDKSITAPSRELEGSNSNSTTSTSTGTGNSGSASGSGNTTGGNNNQRVAFRFTPPTYTISGVFKDFSELKRTAYGLGDFIVPYTSIFPSNMNNQMAQGFLRATLNLSVVGQSLARIEAQVRAVLAREYGDDIQVHVWEGTPNGNSSVLEETRKSLDSFSLVVNLLGFLLLITGSIGILSIMLVEVLGRNRDISLERALGASKVVIVKEYFIRALLMTFTSVMVGILLSLIFAQPLKEIVLPIFSALGDTVDGGSIITPLAILISGASALLIGGIFGILPVFSSLNTVISEGLQDV